VEQALENLERFDPTLAELIIGTFYGGYTAQEMAEITDTPLRTIQRQIKRARGWLRLEMGPKDS